MQSHRAKMLSNKLYKLLQIFEDQENKLEKYRSDVEGFIIQLEGITDKIDNGSILWRNKIGTAKECEKILRRISYMISVRTDRDGDVVDELYEAIDTLEDL